MFVDRFLFKWISEEKSTSKKWKGSYVTENGNPIIHWEMWKPFLKILSDIYDIKHDEALGVPDGSHELTRILD